MLGSRKQCHLDRGPEGRLGQQKRGAVKRGLFAIGALIAAFGTPLAAGIATAAPASADTVVGTCTIVSNPTPTNFTNCPGADLSSANLSGVDLSFANLGGANLTGAILDGTTLVAANLSNANLGPGADFEGASFDHANLSSANLSDLSSTVGCFGSPPDGAVCFSTDFSGANLTDANFTNASLASCQTVNLYIFGSATGCGGAEFSGANLWGANFTRATLAGCSECYGADFSDTLLVPSSQTVTATNKAGAVATWSAPQSLPGATPGPCVSDGYPYPRPATSGTFWVLGNHGVSCQVVDDYGNAASGSFGITVNPSATSCTTLVGCNMSGLNLSGADLLGADLQGANLQSANLSNTELAFAYLPAANLQGADLSDAEFNETWLPGDNLSGANLSGAQIVDPSGFFTNLNLHGANFTGAFLDTDLTGDNLTGANFTNALMESLFTGTLLVPSNQTVTATSAAGAVVTWPTPKSLPGATPGTCSMPSGSTFPIGTTTVTCGVIDFAGNAGSDGTFTVTVNPVPTTT